MPPVDALFAKPPAEQDFLALAQRGEIDQTCGRVFDLAAKDVNAANQAIHLVLHLCMLPVELR